MCAFALNAQKVTPKEKNGLWGFNSGKSRQIEYKYERVLTKEDSYYPVVANGLWGIVNSDGEEIISCQYDSIIPGYQHFIALKAGKYGVVDTKNTVLVDFNYDGIDHYDRNTGATVKIDGTWGTFSGGELDYSRVIFRNPEQAARFGGCEHLMDPEELKTCSLNRMLEFAYHRIRYPALARQNGIQGRVIVEFFISPEGNINDPEVIRDVGAGCGDAVLDVVHQMPAWQPALHDGIPVWSRVILPISFSLGKGAGG
jgi:TonB family protein